MSTGRRTVKVEPLPGALAASIAAHHLAEVAADRQAEAGAAVLARGRRVGLA